MFYMFYMDIFLVQFPQKNSFHRPELRLVLSEGEGVVDACERLLPVAAQRGNAGELDVRLLLVRETPRAAPEKILGTLQIAKSTLHEREVVFRRGVKRARMVLRGARNGPF